jgi:hypothetical protein
MTLRVPREGLAGAAAAALAAAALSASAVQAATPPAYTLTATKRCLVARGVKVTAVQPSDVRLKALHDLAQHTSFQATSKKGTVGIAFSRSARDAASLASLIQVPKDPYHVVLRRNALLMFKTRSKPAFDAVVACLAPR